MKKIVFTISLALAQLSNPAMAHDGHGLSGIHWHATDVLGFVVAAALIGAAFYFGKK